MSNSELAKHVIDVVYTKGDHAYVGGTLLAAGFLPSMFNSQTLSAIYFALLIPPAGLHCYLWAKKYFFPPIIETVKPVVTKIVPIIKDSVWTKIKKFLHINA